MPLKTSLLLTLLVGVCFKAIAQIPDLPEPVSNNAVAIVKNAEGKHLLSFMGLATGKTYKQVHNKVWSYTIGDKDWEARKAVPSTLALKGRLASIAVGIDDTAYVFGGYTVAEDHSEISSPDNFSYDISTDNYQKLSPTPVPVDDAVALSYLQRYIFLISGWHNDGNVNLVQIYDTHNDSWQQGSPFLGAPVFGHAGGIVNNQMLICDGVGVVARQKKRRTFAAQTACYSGTINPKQITKIDWKVVSHPTGTARYRMAASAIDSHSILFAGGATNPYNFNGTGYDGIPSEADDKLWRYSFKTNSWKITTAKTATMDHRGLLPINQKTYVVIGGMENPQQVSHKVSIISASDL